MSTPPKTATGQFAAQSQSDLQAVRQLLAENGAAIEELGKVLPAVHLRDALNKPLEGDAELLDQHRQLQERRDRLRSAESAALHAEEDRRAIARYNEDKSRARALAQHLGKIHASAQKLQAHLRNAHRSFEDIVEAGRMAQATLPAPMRGHTDTVGPLSAHYTARLVKAYLGKLDQESDARIFGNAPPWAEDLKGRDGRVPDLAEMFERLVADLKAQAAHMVMPAPSVTVEPVQPEPTHEVSAVEPQTEAAEPVEAEKAPAQPQPEAAEPVNASTFRQLTGITVAPNGEIVEAA